MRLQQNAIIIHDKLFIIAILFGEENVTLKQDTNNDYLWQIVLGRFFYLMQTSFSLEKGASISF
jgi:hypothetical protein